MTLYRELFPPPTPWRAHPFDAEAAVFHRDQELLPHSHEIKEDWPVEKKNRLGDHLDRYHAPRDGLAGHRT